MRILFTTILFFAAFQVAPAFAEAPPAYVLQWGSSGSGPSQFSSPYGLATDSGGNVYVSDFGNARIQKFNGDGVFQIQWGSSGSLDGQFFGNVGIAIDDSDYVYVTELLGNRVQKFTSSGVYKTQWGTLGSGNGQFDQPWGIAVDHDGNVLVTDIGNSRVQKFTSSGNYMAQWGTSGAIPGHFDYPSGICVDDSGNVYVGDGHSRIQKFTTSGIWQTQWAVPGGGEGWLADDAAGNLYYTGGTSLDVVTKYTSMGGLLTQWGSHGSGIGQFSNPYGVAVHGNNIYVADNINNRVQTFVAATTDVGPHPKTSGIALSSPRPNPSRDRIAVWFTLPGGGAAQLSLLDPTGRLIESHELQGLTPGEHRVEFLAGRDLPSGVFLVTLRQGMESRSTKAIVLH